MLAIVAIWETAEDRRPFHWIGDEQNFFLERAYISVEISADQRGIEIEMSGIEVDGLDIDK